MPSLVSACLFVFWGVLHPTFPLNLILYHLPLFCQHCSAVWVSYGKNPFSLLNAVSCFLFFATLLSCSLSFISSPILSLLSSADSAYLVSASSARLYEYPMARSFFFFSTLNQFPPRLSPYLVLCFVLIFLVWLFRSFPHSSSHSPILVPQFSSPRFSSWFRLPGVCLLRQNRAVVGAIIGRDHSRVCTAHKELDEYCAERYYLGVNVITSEKRRCWSWCSGPIRLSYGDILVRFATRYSWQLSTLFPTKRGNQCRSRCMQYLLLCP